MKNKIRKYTFRSNKLIYLFAVLVSIFLGLSSRTYGQHLPLFVMQHAGDFIWAMMVYFGFRLLLTHQKLYVAFFLSIAFSFGNEFSQLYQADWINHIRGTIFGGLILGKGFLTVDLLRYTAGICSAAIMDKWLLQINTNQ